MSKEYLCKDCGNNNHGWCTVKRMNGLKGITECKSKTVQNEEGSQVYMDILGDEYVDTDTGMFCDDNLQFGFSDFNEESHKNYGKREMFYIIQQQLQAMNDTDTVEEVKKLMVNLEEMLKVGEQIHGIASNSIIDGDNIRNSKALSILWAHKYGNDIK